MNVDVIVNPKERRNLLKFTNRRKHDRSMKTKTKIVNDGHQKRQSNESLRII